MTWKHLAQVFLKVWVAIVEGQNINLDAVSFPSREKTLPLRMTVYRLEEVRNWFPLECH